MADSPQILWKRCQGLFRSNVNDQQYKTWFLPLKFKSFDMTDSTTGFPYDVASWTGYGGAGYAWYGPPVNLSNNVSKLHAQFFNQEGYDPSETVDEISNSISNLTGIY